MIDKFEYYIGLVVNESNNFYLISEANNLLNNFKKKLEPDILMLNSNPFIKKENFSVLHNSIWAYHNNQYYILQKISSNLKRDIRIKSIVLNVKNLSSALQEKGKILIIQSDDFNEDGEIVLETDIGEGEPLSNKNLKDIIPKKINYEVVILCFIKSEKLVDLFKGNVRYLITFNDINIEDVDLDLLLKYNELSIDFIIHFIKNSTESNIIKSFEESLQTFKTGLDNFQNGKIELINKNSNYITLHIFEEDMSRSSIIFPKKEKYIEKGIEKVGKIMYTYPLLQIPSADLHINFFTDDILHLIRLILSPNKQIINIHLQKDVQLKYHKLNIKTIISFEIMRFLYRHQKFNGKIYYASNPKLGVTLKEITNNVVRAKMNKNNSKEKINFVEDITSAFIVVNNYEKINKVKGNKKGKISFFDGIPKNYHYLILSKLPIERAYNYEISSKKEDINLNIENFGKKSSKKNKNKLKKISSKNKINNQIKDSNNFQNTSNQNNNKINNIISNKKLNSDKKKNEINSSLKSRYDHKSDFTIIDHISSSESSNSESDSNESKDSDSDN